MSKIIMLKDDRGSRTGTVVESFECGKEYDVPEDLARCFLSTQSARLVTLSEGKKADAPDNKALDSAPENKSRVKRKE